MIVHLLTASCHAFYCIPLCILDELKNVLHFTNCILVAFCIVFYCCALCILDAHFDWHVNCRALWHKWHANHKALFTDNCPLYRESKREQQPTKVRPGRTKVPKVSQKTANFGVSASHCLPTQLVYLSLFLPHLHKTYHTNLTIKILPQKQTAFTAPLKAHTKLHCSWSQTENFTI